MKSKVMIDVDDDNQPILKVEYIPSDDVRDKLVKIFTETFGGASAWCRIRFVENPSAPVLNNTLVIRPISEKELGSQADEMVGMHNCWRQGREKSE